MDASGVAKNKKSYRHGTGNESCERKPERSFCVKRRWSRSLILEKKNKDKETKPWENGAARSM